LAVRICKEYNEAIELPIEITMSDINPNMLDVGKRRAVERGIFHGI